MKAIAVNSWAEGPLYNAGMPTLPAPATPDIVQLKVLTSGLHNVVRSQASGKHYTTQNSLLPYIPGSDGVGLDSTGSLVYFNSINTGGGFASHINVSARAIFPIPTPANTSVDDKRKIAVDIAALMNPAMSSWMALTTRTTNLQPGFTVLILGATSLSGRIAIQLARSLGAKKVIGVARSADELSKLDLDASVALSETVDSTDYSSVLQDYKIDVILDYVYGPATIHLFNSLPSNPATAHDNEVQYVEIGGLSSPDMLLPGALLRSKNITIRGSGPGSWSVTKNVAEQYPKLLQRMVEGVGKYDIQERSLEEAKGAWASKARSVFVM